MTGCRDEPRASVRTVMMITPGYEADGIGAKKEMKDLSRSRPNHSNLGHLSQGGSEGTATPLGKRKTERVDWPRPPLAPFECQGGFVRTRPPPPTPPSQGGENA